MKAFKLFFAVCLAPLALHGAMATEYSDVVRAAVRRAGNITGDTTTTKNTRHKAPERTSDTTTAPATTTSRVLQNPRERGTGIQSRTGTNTTQSVSTRPVAPSSTATRSVQSGTARTAPTVKNNTRQTVSARTAMGANTIYTPRRGTTTIGASAPRRTTARAASSNTIAATQTLTQNYQQCRNVFNDCMDEFCANKDASLRRCACSARIHEFDEIKSKLNKLNDKMLDFNERLLAVNMDKEDVNAIYTETAGEIAFNNTSDKTQSKRALDEIAKKLNISFKDNKVTDTLAPISLSLNTDAAFDSIDSFFGSSVTTKSGTDLYADALPLCQEMSAEVCTAEELEIAESAYKMMIEQDCNTVKKSYQAKTDEAHDKIRESSALLDMSRLDIYQQRNSDDIITCKQKILDRLTDPAVCGADMGKCLDVSGRYIDPSTGQAFLTVNLAELGSLITRPTSHQTWTNAPGNSVFVNFLNSKKKFLTPATENCQKIADTVWTEFLDDALAQIKLAQENKLESMRQSCTTLTTQCVSDTMETIQNFDARALSIFGINADKATKVICNDVMNACSALLQTTADTPTNQWTLGMTEIANVKTYESILQTCREIGRTCISNVCTSNLGTFDLCALSALSNARPSLLYRQVCWDQVVQCVADAGDSNINAIVEQLYPSGKNAFYQKTYGNIPNPISDLCSSECASNSTVTKCNTCRIAEQIWGNCEHNPLTETPFITNKILIPYASNNQTLLAWFAQKTNSVDMSNSCNPANSCPTGQSLAYMPGTQTLQCYPDSDIDACHRYCSGNKRYMPQGQDSFALCCPNNLLLTIQNGISLCPNGTINGHYYSFTTAHFNWRDVSVTDNIGHRIYFPQDKTVQPMFILQGKMYFCVGGNDMTVTNDNDGHPTNCNNGYIIIYDTVNKLYLSPSDSDTMVTNSYSYPVDSTCDTCTCIYENGNWTTSGNCPDTTNCANPNTWQITYNIPN